MLQSLCWISTMTSASTSFQWFLKVKHSRCDKANKMINLGDTRTLQLGDPSRKATYIWWSSYPYMCPSFWRLRKKKLSKHIAALCSGKLMTLIHINYLYPYGSKVPSQEVFEVWFWGFSTCSDSGHGSIGYNRSYGYISHKPTESYWASCGALLSTSL